MILNIDSTGGLIRIGPFAILWQNGDEEFSGFTTLSTGTYSLEFGEIDQGNGIFITKYSDDDIEYIKPLLQF